MDLSVITDCSNGAKQAQNRVLEYGQVPFVLVKAERFPNLVQNFFLLG